MTAGTAAGGARAHRLRAGVQTLELGARPVVMGVVNASPDSFSDDAGRRTLEDRVRLAQRLRADGAEIIDVGGESATTGRPSVDVDVEIERVAPLIERVASFAIVSVDTYKPDVARAAIAAGASIVNDVSGLRDVGLASVCAESGAALVVMHTRAAPRERLQDPGRYDDVTEDVLAFLRERSQLAIAAGVARDRLIVDPGPDFAKTPAQTIALLSQLERIHELALPLLLAVSRKDFIGALTGRAPRERLGGTLAALARGVDAGSHILRVHDVAATADFLAVRDALNGRQPPSRDLALAEELRHERFAG